MVKFQSSYYVSIVHIRTKRDKDVNFGEGSVKNGHQREKVNNFYISNWMNSKSSYIYSKIFVHLKITVIPHFDKKNK